MEYTVCISSMNNSNWDPYILRVKSENQNFLACPYQLQFFFFFKGGLGECVGHVILVSAQVPLVLVFEVYGTRLKLGHG